LLELKAQTVPQLPQLLGSELKPMLVQLQIPPEQVLGDKHLPPPPPQLLLSVVVSEQLPLQHDWPEGQF